MYYDKRIRYLSYYESDIKLQNAGYVKFQVRDSLCQMVIYVKGPRLMGSGEAGVYLLSKKQAGAEKDGFYAGSRDSRLQKHLLGNLSICNGQGHCAVRMNAENMADSGLRYDEICGIKIELHEYQYLESQWNVVNFMPERQGEPHGESRGYKLRAPRDDSRSPERKNLENYRDGSRENGENEAAEEEPVKINLMVTPVSEKLRVEKLTQAEEIVPVEVQEENIVTEMSERSTEEDAAELPAGDNEDRESGASAERITDEEDISMQEMLERAIQREEAQSEETVQSEQSEQAGQEWEERSVQEMPEGERQEQEADTAEEGIRPEEQALRPDKWEQLKKTYPVVHPIREDEEYLKIAPKDFVIFTEKYQSLVHNSFLLHGYYNYKHLILGRKERDGRVIYYLGVPGTFHDREKAVAVMFGFEAFDGKREPAENGDFGYYLRRVEI